MAEVTHTCTAEDRFDRIESWLAKLAEQMERVTELLFETRTNRKVLEDHETRLRALEKNDSRNALIVKWVERIIWMAIVSGLALRHLPIN